MVRDPQMVRDQKKLGNHWFTPTIVLERHQVKMTSNQYKLALSTTGSNAKCNNHAEFT